jgi:hypothetical protein
MHDKELLRRAQYNQDNGPPDDLHVIPTAHAPSASREWSTISQRSHVIFARSDTPRTSCQPL